jgi:hypothetical protein
MPKPEKAPPPGKEWRLEPSSFEELATIAVPTKIVSKLKTGDMTVERYLASRLVQALQKVLQDVEGLPPFKTADGDDEGEYLGWEYGWKPKPHTFSAEFSVSIGRARKKWKLLKIKGGT